MSSTIFNTFIVNGAARVLIRTRRRERINPDRSLSWLIATYRIDFKGPSHFESSDGHHHPQINKKQNLPPDGHMDKMIQENSSKPSCLCFTFIMFGLKTGTVLMPSSLSFLLT